MADLEKSKKHLISELQRRKNNYITTYKKVKRLVESAAGQKTFDDFTKEKFRVAALETNKAHKEFREFLLPFFSETTIREVFPEETLSEENENLKGAAQELHRNKQTLDTLVEQLSEKCSLQSEKLQENETLQLTVSTLQKQLEEYKNQNVELKKLLNKSDVPDNRTHKLSGNKSDQQDLLIRDLEHRLSFRQKSKQNSTRRDRHIELCLEKIYKISEDVEMVSMALNEFSGSKGDSDHLYFKNALMQNLSKLDNISDLHTVVRSERGTLVRKVQTLLEVLNSKCS